MLEIPYLDFFTYEKMDKNPGLYNIVFSHNKTTEAMAEEVVFYSIAQAKEKYPNKEIYISLTDSKSYKKLEFFLEQRGLDTSFIQRCKSSIEFLELYSLFTKDDKQNFAGIFVANNRFFDLDSKFNASATKVYRTNNLKKFYAATPKLLRVISTQADWFFNRVIKSYDFTVDSISRAESHTVILIKHQDKKNMVVTCIKDKSGTPEIKILFKIHDENFWTPHIKNESNFFQYKAEKAIITIKNRTVLPEIKNSFEFFEKEKVSKSVKKAILDKSIVVEEAQGSSNKFVGISYEYVNIYTLMKRFFKDDFDPNHFVSALNQEMHFNVNQSLYRERYDELEFLLSLGQQKQIYEWFHPKKTKILNDSLSMIQSLKEKEINIVLRTESKTILEIHNNLMELLDLSNPEIKYSLKNQEKLIPWNQKEITVLREDKPINLSLLIPQTTEEFKAIGQKMGLCIRFPWFWKQLASYRHQIVILKENDKLAYCLEINSQKQIQEAKTTFNNDLEEALLDSIQAQIQHLST